MPMGIVSDSDFDKELSRVSSEREESKSHQSEKTENPVITGVIENVSRGRGEGSTSVPDGLRKIIGEESVTNGRASALELASQFGLSASSVSAYANGSTSTATYDRTPNRGHINEARVKIQNKARGKLMQSLRHLTSDKLEKASARDLSGIAKDMSAVVRNMEPESSKNPMDDKSGPTFVFYSPQVRQIKDFEKVTVKE